MPGFLVWPLLLRVFRPPIKPEGRLADEALRFKKAAEKEPLGSHARELLLRRARQAETASHINDWVSSPGLQPPKDLEKLQSDQN
jgi:hypothetical protein